MSGDAAALADAYWIDISEPTAGEQQAVEEALDLRLRVPEEPASFQISTPLRASDGIITLTALLLARLEDRQPELVTVQFIKSRESTCRSSIGAGATSGRLH